MTVENRIAVPKPKIYTCQEWGADPPMSSLTVVQPSVYINHHTAGANRSLIGDPQKALEYAFQLARDIQQAHFAEGWVDTGNSFLITRDAIILEGRHNIIDAIEKGKCIVGAHCVGQNGSPGTEHEGTYDDIMLTSEMWDASVHLCAWVLYCTKIDSDKIYGHRDFNQTDCPGQTFYPQLGRFKSDVHRVLVGQLKLW